MDTEQQTKNKIQVSMDDLCKKGFLRRNALCLCGSGKKVKKCCKFLLDFRPKHIQQKMTFEVAYSNYVYNQIKSGFKKPSREKFVEYLEERKIESEIENKNPVSGQEIVNEPSNS